MTRAHHEAGLRVAEGEVGEERAFLSQTPKRSMSRKGWLVRAGTPLSIRRTEKERGPTAGPASRSRKAAW